MANNPEYIQKLIQVYQQSQQNLINIIADKNIKDDNFAQYEKNLLAQINIELAKLQKYSNDGLKNIFLRHMMMGLAKP